MIVVKLKKKKNLSFSHSTLPLPQSCEILIAIRINFPINSPKCLRELEILIPLKLVWLDLHIFEISYIIMVIIFYSTLQVLCKSHILYNILQLYYPVILWVIDAHVKTIKFILNLAYTYIEYNACMHAHTAIQGYHWRRITLVKKAIW